MNYAVTQPILTIVVPCYNEEAVLAETARRLDLLLTRLIAEKIIASSSHVFIVDDGSSDNTWVIVQTLHAVSYRFSGISLSRNCGHQNALMTGLLAAQGDVVVSLDADLQDDLDAIKAMLAAAAAGYAIVYGVRSLRSGDTMLKRLTARLYYRLLHWLSVEIVYDHADFRPMTRRTLEALREYEETNLFLHALIPQPGFQTSVVTYDPADGLAGTSKYPLCKMAVLALEGITLFTTKPIRMVTFLGFAVSGLALILTIWTIVAKLVFQTVVPGWAATVMPIYLSCSVQLLCLDVIGRYVGKTYLETKCRPQVLVAEALLPLSEPLVSTVRSIRLKLGIAFTQKTTVFSL